MSNSVQPSAPATRDSILAHATKLRERIVQGECPYPDAAMEANESFITRLKDTPGADLSAVAKAAKKAEDSAGGWGIGYGAAGVAGLVALGIFSFVCAPMPINAVIAASGALAVRTLFRMAGQANAQATGPRRFNEQLDAWERHNSEDVPKIASWQGEIQVDGLKLLTRNFATDVQGFPYAHELTREHERLMAALPKDSADRKLSDVTADLLKESKTTSSQLTRNLSSAGRTLANVGWMSGAAALAAGVSPWITGGLFGAMLAGKGLVLLADQVADRGMDTRRAARSLHYWAQAMAARPPIPQEALVFGTDPQPKDIGDGKIERSQADVKLGRVTVPVKRREAKPAVAQ